MLLKLDVLASTTIKRKKPWPKLAWLGKDVGDLFLFDSYRISQLYLPSGKTKKKIPLLQSYLEDVQGFGVSSNGFFVAGALNSGRIFIWNKSAATVKLTAVLDKIRNVQPGTRHTSLLKLCVSDCGTKVLLLWGFRQVFLWETQGSNGTLDGVGDSLRGIWLQIQCGTYVLPDEKDKETAIDGVFFVDPVCGTSCSVSWVFNKGDKIHVTTLHLLWPEKNYSLPVDSSSNQVEEGVVSAFTPSWRTFKHSLFNLTPAERVIKSRKAYIARVSPDGQVMVIAMNQKLAAHNRVMFYSLAQSAVAVIADLKGCGAKLNASSNAPSGRSWWVADMAWTRDSLLVLCISRRGSVAILSKLGEPVQFCTEGCSLHTGPALFLPLHPKITFQKASDALQADSSESCASERDPLSQRFSVSVHPYLPVILSSDGYLVTLMQLPPVASYQGIMTGFMKDVTRLIPDVDVEIQAGGLSRVSSLSRINILQSEANISRGITSTEFLSDAPSDNNSTGSSTMVPGYGLASGDQGMSFFGLSDPELETSLPEYIPGSLDAISHAQSLSIVALALGSACGVNWKREIGPAMDLTVNVVVKVFQFLLRSENTSQLRSFSKAFSSSSGDLTKRRSSSPVVDSQLSKALAYFRMILEVFQWDSCHRNVFTWAFHLTHGVVREILLARDASVVYRVTSCMRVLKLAERVLSLVYSSSNETLPSAPNVEPDLQSVLVKQESDQVKQEYQQVEQEKQESEQVSQETGQDKPDAEVVKQERELVQREFKELKQDSSRTVKEEDSETNVLEDGTLDKDRNEFTSQPQQQTVTQTQLSGSWLLLYNFTSENCKKMQRRRSSLFSAQEGENRRSVEKGMVELLCEIQEKLQALGVRIPTNAGVEKESIEGVSAYLDRTYHSLPPEGPQDSLFSRRRSSLQETAGRAHSPETPRRYGTPYRDNSESQQSRDNPSRLSPAGIPHGSVNERDSKALLSILYLHLQQYDLRAALDLIYSLIEPTFSCEQLENSGIFSFLPNAQVGSHQSNTNHRVDVLLQHYPIARVADKQGLKAVQTLARFMSAYFSNLSLYVFPPYQPVALPAFHDHENHSAHTGQEERPQALEHVTLDRAKVAQAVRDQGLYELWSANSTLELLLVSGLVSEAAWLAKNLGDWKNAMFLSFASDILTSRYSQTANDLQIQLAFPAPPHDIKANTIAVSRLNPAFEKATSSGEEKTSSSADEKSVSDLATARKSRRTQPSAVDPETEVDGKVVKEVSRVLEAGVVSGLDLVPSILTTLLIQLKEVASMFTWIVPEEFYLPYPPSYCPQPINLKKDAMSAAAEKEEALRAEVAGTVQRILLLLNASNCLAPCVRWYTEQLVLTTESWCNVERSDPGFPVPSSLAGYADRGFSFHEKRGYVSPKKKGKGSSEAPPRGKEGKSIEKLPSSIKSVLSCFRHFCAIMWLLHARDKMTKSSRKYRQLRSQSSGSEEETTTIQSICWETLLWTTRLAPFSSFLGAADKINDTLLTLLSELPPSVATAELTAQFFNDPEVVQTASGRAKFKRLMAQFRGVTVQDDEPLSVVYRQKCMDWIDELSERENLFGKVCDQFFTVDDGYESIPTYGRASDERTTYERATKGRATGGGSFDEGTAIARQEDQAIAVGTAFFETQSSYFQFLDTFFMITVSKTVLAHHSKVPYPVPLLSAYNKHLLAADTKSLTVLLQKAHSNTPAKAIKGASSLFRSQSFTDVRSSRSKPEAPTPSSGSGVGDIKRSSSMNDVAKLGSLPGIQTLGSEILDLLPCLTWLSRWILEGSSLPSSTLSTRGDKGSLPVMRVYVSLPLLVNGLWLLQNVYWPWVSNAEVVVDIKVIRQISPPRRLPDTAKESSPSLKSASTPPKRLRKVLSDSNIQQSAEMSPKRNSMPSERLRYRLEADYHHRSTPEMLEKLQGEARSPAYGLTESSSHSQVQAQQEAIQLRGPVRKDLRASQQLDRIPKSNSEPNIPNIVVQSPTTDEEKDFSGALKKRHTLQGNGRSPTTYHSDTELTSPVKPIVTSTPAKTKRSKKPKRRERKSADVSEEEQRKVTSGSTGDVSDWRKQHWRGRTTEGATPAQQQQSAETLQQRELNTDFQPVIRTVPPRQGKRKKKPSVETKITMVDGSENLYEKQEGFGTVVASDSKQANAAEPSEWSQSSATEAMVSQRKMELVLVVRPGESGEPSAFQSGIPLLRIPTVVESSQSSDVTSQGHNTKKTTKTETASQTDRQALASAASQTPRHSGMPSAEGHVTHPDQQRLATSTSQTPQYYGIPSEEGHVNHPDQQRLISSTSQTVPYPGIHPERGYVSHQTSHAVHIQTDPSSEPKPAMTSFPLLLQQQQAYGLQTQLSNATNNSQPQTAQHQNQPFTSASRALPLLRLPVVDPASKLDLSKMRLFEIPKQTGNTPLLHFPETKATTSQPVPDLSKIKFLKIQPKKEMWPKTTETKGPSIAGAPSYNWPLLTGSQPRSHGVDLSKMKLYENPPLVREAWPLLETPKKEEAPKLIPLEKILAFEKGMRDKLAPFSEPPARYLHEKENIRPPMENEVNQMQSRPPDKGIEPENKRNTASRQRRRQALEKQTRPRSTSPLYKSRRGRAASRSKFSQGKVVTVQPTKKARKVEKELSEKRRQESEPATKKPRRNKPETVQKAVVKKETRKSVSISESELELSEISGQALDISEEEEYFRVERSPEPIALTEDDHRQPSKRRNYGLTIKGREQNIQEEEREPSKESAQREPSKALEYVLPGPPSMQHIKERIGRKLHEVDQQMAAFRSGGTTLDKGREETVGGRQVGQGSTRQQNTVGVQVGEESKPSQVKSVGFFHSSFPDRVELGSTFKVTSSSQTDQPLPWSPPVRRDRALVTSGVQTEKSSSDSDHVTSHAPVLPPDIFLNLQMPKPGQNKVLPPESVIDYDQAVTDRPLPIRGRQIGVDMEGESVGAPPARSTDVDQDSSSFPVDVRGRQFLSVADIDHDQWLEVQSTPMTAVDEIPPAELEEEQSDEEKRRDSFGTGTEDLSRKEVRGSPKYEFDEELWKETQVTERQSYEGADKVTVDMMDSKDVPVERFYPLPFPTASQSSARALSTKALNEISKEMSERIEAMDQIKQNMDREFKSSRVLLSAIQSIDEVLNPPFTEVRSLRGSRESRQGKPQRWGDTAPWRKKLKTSQAPRRPFKTEGVEDSIDVDVEAVQKGAIVDAAEVKDESDKEQSSIEELVGAEGGTDEDDGDKSFDQQQEDDNESVEHQSRFSSEEEERASEKEEEPEDKQTEDSTENKAKTSVDKDVRPSTSEDRERGGKAYDPLESLTLSQDKLREILREKDPKRTRDPSPDAREQLKEWMKTKRSERQAEWRNQQGELRAQEHQPFMSPTQGSTSFKKMKLVEKDRDVKRRKMEDQHKQKRIESASNLLSEMLTEPVPRPKDRQPNLRYGGNANSHYSKPLPGKKKRIAERRKKLPKGSQKGRHKLRQEGAVNGTSLQQSVASTKENYSLPQGTYRTGSLFSEEIPKTYRSPNTPRFDVIRTSSPGGTGEQSLRRFEPKNTDPNEDKFDIKERITEDDFWRSKSPTGAEFVTTKTYRDFAKNQPKRMKARDAALRKTPPAGMSGYRLAIQPRGVEAMGRTYARTRRTDPPLPGSETLSEIDRLLEEDDDGGLTLDQENLDGIESLLEGDEELRDLLSDVDWRSVSKPQSADSKRTGVQPSSLFSRRERDNWQPELRRDYNLRNVEPTVPSGSGLSREFDVSPWNIGQNLRTSDDVAQLLADVDAAVGNMSESTGSPRSHIDWEEVDKIMGEA